ncbi:WD40 repeat-like protein [Westerdykella ornata]|uniref:WD40 repeat-like protein n=1 Tax=Westerdykella ornata TaxID=318751 RepID=A0A6A6J8P8_WESOR|nr:WD40 repeat-like protein [Westerdykella ornata]KAF2272627.1 WD40 repeat-like protein [Westerdykella ornata]
MTTLTPTLKTTASLPPSTFIYRILPTGPRLNPYTYTTPPSSLAITASDDSLRFLDPATLSLLPAGVITKVHESVTCLERADDAAGNLLVTAGRDGTVKMWDGRLRAKGACVLRVDVPHKLVSAIVCDYEKSFLAAGIENPNDGPGDTPVYIWDIRSPSTPRLTLPDSHTDTLTTLSLHPSHPTLLLTSSTDNLLSIFDTSAADEEDALYQVINHGSAVAHAGFLLPADGNGEGDIFALGTDETVSFYALQSSKEEDVEPSPRVMGDVRERLGVEYLVGVMGVGGERCVVGGKHSANALSMIPIRKNASSGPLAYDFDISRSLHFPGAHGEEIVRDVFVDIHTNTAYTVGEDSYIRAWSMPSSNTPAATSTHPADMDIDDAEEEDATEKRGTEKEKRKKDRKEKRRDKKDKKKEKERFKPY